LAVVPAVLVYLVMKLHAWRDRRAGRRFSHYDVRDFPQWGSHQLNVI